MDNMQGKSYLSITEVVAALNAVLSKHFVKVYFQGEISSLKIYPSGHAYFDLKDENSVLNAAIYSSYL